MGCLPLVLCELPAAAAQGEGVAAHDDVGHAALVRWDALFIQHVAGAAAHRGREGHRKKGRAQG